MGHSKGRVVLAGRVSETCLRSWNRERGVTMEQHNECDCHGPKCAEGIYLFDRMTEIDQLVAMRGFVFLTKATRDQILAEYEKWRTKYRKHKEKPNVSVRRFQV